MKPKKSVQNSEWDISSKLLVIFSAVIYGAFVTVSFVKCPFCWGINFLYYLEMPVKVSVIIAGAIAFIPKINLALLGIYDRIGIVIYSFENKIRGKAAFIAYRVILAVCAGAVFYVFRVVSLYHDPMGAIYFFKRNIPISEFYKHTEMGLYKNIFLLWAPLRYLLFEKLQFDAYTSLAFTSILFGMLFVFLLHYLAAKLELKPLQRLFLTVMVFCQAITYSYFGFANIYAIVPVLIFAYVLSVVKYYRGEAPVWYPVAAAVLVTFVHMGAALILPSLVFILVEKNRDHIVWLNRVMTFQNWRISAGIISGSLILFYVGAYLFLQSDYFGGGGFRYAIIQPFSIPEQYPDLHPLFSINNAIHVANVFLLLSPMGMLLFGVLLRYFHEIDAFGGLKFALLWLAAGGILFIVFLPTMSLHGWDTYAWGALGYVFLGTLLFTKLESRIRKYRYLFALVLTHSMLYFCSWIAMNNNVFASVLNFVESTGNDHGKIKQSMRILGQDAREPENTKRLFQKLERYNLTSEEYSLMIGNYLNILKDSTNASRMQEKYIIRVMEEIKNDPDNLDTYYSFLNSLSNEFNTDAEYRNVLEPLYIKMTELKPDNVHLAVIYGNYLWKLRDYGAALRQYEIADSLFLSREDAVFQTNYSYAIIQIGLSYFNFIRGYYPAAVRYCEKAVMHGAKAGDMNFDVALLCAVSACLKLDDYERARYFNDVYGRTFARGGDAHAKMAEVIRIFESKKNRRYLEFMTAIGPPSDEKNKIVNSHMDFEKFAHSEILPYANSLIVKGDYDSVRICGQKLMECAPHLFHGYFLAGVYQKNSMRDYRAADSLFDLAIAAVKKSSRSEKDIIITRIREIKINN